MKIHNKYMQSCNGKEFIPNKLPDIGLADYVRNKQCLDCDKPTIKFNRCKKCYYKHMGWNTSRLLDKQKQEPMVTPTTQMNEPVKMLKDSVVRFRSESGFYTT